MLNPEAHLKENLFDAKDQAPARDGFGEALLALGQNNQRVVVLCADLAESTRVLAFKEKFPERFVEVGVAEQNLAAVASGMAACGKIPFIASYATFSPGRNNEQIRTTISINKMPVKIAGMHAGVSVGPDGATHQALEDIALMRVQPNMTLISVCDKEEARKATLAAAEYPGPVYLRFSREKTPCITTEETPLVFGKAYLAWMSRTPKVAVFATGPLLFNTLVAAHSLAEELDVEVYNVHTIKPLDRETIIEAAKKTGAVVTVEEHQVAGGMGSAIAELLAQKCPVPIEFIGVHDQFGQSGTPTELIEHYGMGVEYIKKAIRAASVRRT